MNGLKVGRAQCRGFRTTTKHRNSSTPSNILQYGVELKIKILELSQIENSILCNVRKEWRCLSRSVKFFDLSEAKAEITPDTNSHLW